MLLPKFYGSAVLSFIIYAIVIGMLGWALNATGGVNIVPSFIKDTIA